MVKCPENYIAWINQALKVYTRIMSKKILNIHLRLKILNIHLRL